MIHMYVQLDYKFSVKQINKSAIEWNRILFYHFICTYIIFLDLLSLNVHTNTAKTNFSSTNFSSTVAQIMQ